MEPDATYASQVKQWKMLLESLHTYLTILNGEEVTHPIWFPRESYYIFEIYFSASGYYVYYMDWFVICFSPWLKPVFMSETLK